MSVHSVNISDVWNVKENYGHLPREEEIARLRAKVDTYIQEHQKAAEEHPLDVQTRMEERLGVARKEALQAIDELASRCVARGFLMDKIEECYRNIDTVAKNVFLASSKYQEETGAQRSRLAESIAQEKAALARMPMERQEQRIIDRLKEERSYSKPGLAEDFSQVIKCLGNNRPLAK